MSTSYSGIKVSTPNSTDNNASFTFDVDPATDCFNMYAYPQTIQKNDPKAIPWYGMTITNPNDQQNYPQHEYSQYLYEEMINGNNVMASGSSDTVPTVEFSLPIVESPAIQLPGTWTGKTSPIKNAATVPLTLTCVERVTQGNVNTGKYTLEVNVVLYCSGKSKSQKKAWVKSAFEGRADYLDTLDMGGIVYYPGFKGVKDILAQASITCSYGDITVLPLPGSSEPPITINFTDPGTKAAVEANAKTDKLTVIIVENLTATETDSSGTEWKTGGVSGGIPGPQGFINQFAAVLIDLPTHPSYTSTVAVSALAHVIAHEIGHYLGLTHWSSAKDPSKQETTQDPYNLMCDGAYQAPVPGNKLNAKQLFIMQRMPLVRILYSTRKLASVTPVTSLEVTITTGTRTYLNAPQENSKMALYFSLGSDANGYQTWILNDGAPSDCFDPGTTYTFQLTDISNLYMEDLVTWKIHCDWNDYMLSPLNFFMLANYWDFDHIKITANDTVIQDLDIKTILSWVVQQNIQNNF